MPTSTNRKPQEIAADLAALIDNADRATVAPNLQAALRLQAEFCQAMAQHASDMEEQIGEAMQHALDAGQPAEADTQPAA